MRLVKILLLCALWVPWASVASPHLPQTGDDIIERALEALGGPAALEATRSVALEATGSLTMGGSKFEASMRHFNVRPDELRIEVSLEGAGIEMEIVQGTDGEDFWLSTNQVVTDLPADQIPQVRQNAESILPGMGFRRFIELGVEFEYLGRRSLRGTDVYHIRYTTPAEYTISSQDADVEWYFSVETGLPFASAMNSIAGEVFTWYEDYRRVAMFMMPFRWETETRGQPTWTVTMQSVETNKPIDPSLFKRPGG